jgi:carboxypeptidase C (cathepsin A)
MQMRLLAILLLAIGIAPLPFQGNAAPEAENKPAAADTAKKAMAGEPALPEDSVTTHTLKLRGADINYIATAGTLPLTSKTGDKIAEVFFVAYTMNNAENGGNRATRPLTFVFNGGPGAGSAYLHVGAIGPRVLDFGTGRNPNFSDAKLIDNPDTWLDLTDLVFIDPVGTGYSRPTIGEDDARKAFWGVHQDLDALSAIIRHALARLDRFGSPVYLAGESYGGFRAARLPLLLAQKEGVPVAGAVLISPILEFSLRTGDTFNPMPWALALPSYAAVKLETLGRLTPDALKDVERFALGDYLSALAAGSGDPTLSAPLLGELADDIGLPKEMIQRWQGRIPTGVFVKAIRHDEGELVSRYDGTVGEPDPYPASYTANGGDPILEGSRATFTTSFTGYVRSELRFKTDRRYELLAEDVSRQWAWHDDRQGLGSIGASDDLRKGLALDPRLKVLIAHGMTDLVTPYFADRYVIDHLPETLTRDRVTLKLYRGGHMMYLRSGSRADLHADMRGFYGPPEAPASPTTSPASSNAPGAGN